MTKREITEAAYEVLDLCNGEELSAACEEYANISGMSHKDAVKLYDEAYRLMTRPVR